MNHACIHLRNSAFLCVLISLAIASCSLLGEDDREAKTTRWVTATAVYDEVNQNGAPVQRIALIDFDDPSNFRILARDSVTFGERPRFSPDKQRIIFENRVTPVSAGGHLTLLQVMSENTRLLYLPGNDKPGPPFIGRLNESAWTADGTGLFSTSYGALYRYDIETGLVETIGMGGILYDLKGSDSLLVRSVAPGDSVRTFLFLDTKTGKFLERIENDHLRFVPDDNSGWNRAVHNAAYNDKDSLIAFEVHESTDDGFTARIAVTDLGGSFFRTYTSGDGFLDRNPRWGPDGVVLFDRVRPRSPGGWRDFRVMVLDIETGEINELVEPRLIDGASGLRNPDF